MPTIYGHAISERCRRNGVVAASVAEARGRFFNTGNAFNIVNPPVPDHAFVRRAKARAG